MAGYFKQTVGSIRRQVANLPLEIAGDFLRQLPRDILDPTIANSV
jgi:hypothetical protein